MQAVTEIKKLCTPAFVYLVIAVFGLIVVMLQNVGNTNKLCVGRVECSADEEDDDGDDVEPCSKHIRRGLLRKEKAVWASKMEGETRRRGELRSVGGRARPTGGLPTRALS